MQSGIYGIQNTVNGKWYVGQSTTLLLRKQMHFTNLKYSRHHNGHLQAAYKKYGAEKFKFFVIEEAEPDSLDFLEATYIAMLAAQDQDFGYNQESGGGVGRNRSPEVCRRISQSNMGKIVPPEVIEKVRRANLGKKRTKEVCDKLSKVKREWYLNNPDKAREQAERRRGQEVSKEARDHLREAWHMSEASKLWLEELHRQRRGVPHSPETRKKIAIANTGKRHSEKTKRLFSEQRKGRKLSPEGRARQIASLTGRIKSPEECRRISIGKKGRPWTLRQREEFETRRKKNGVPTFTISDPSGPASGGSVKPEDGSLRHVLHGDGKNLDSRQRSEDLGPESVGGLPEGRSTSVEVGPGNGRGDPDRYLESREVEDWQDALAEEGYQEKRLDLVP